MIILLDCIVLDFLEWISQTYPRNEIFLDSVLYDKELLMSYAEEYLHKERKFYDCRQCKRILKKYFNQVIDSKEFDNFLREYCKNGNCKEGIHYCIYQCLYRCYDEFEYLLENLEPCVLVDSLYFYLEKNGVKDNPTLQHFMVGCSNKELSSILDFLNWLKE